MGGDTTNMASTTSGSNDPNATAAAANTTTNNNNTNTNTNTNTNNTTNDNAQPPSLSPTEETSSTTASTPSNTSSLPLGMDTPTAIAAADDDDTDPELIAAIAASMAELSVTPITTGASNQAQQLSAIKESVPFGSPSATYFSALTQYDPSIDAGKSACTFIAGLATLTFLNKRPLNWEPTLQCAAALYITFQGLADSGRHSNLEEAMSTIATAPECAADEFLLPLVRGLDDVKFGVLLRSSKPRELPPQRSRVPQLQDLVSLFGEDFLVDMLVRVLEMNGDNAEEATNYLLEHRETVLAQQLVHEETLQEQHRMELAAWGGFGRPYRRLPAADQLRVYAQNEQQIYRHLQSRIAQERELLQAQAALYEVVEGKRGLGQWAMRQLEPFLYTQRVAVVFTAQMQTMCLLIDETGHAMFRDSHRNEQYDFESVASFFAWLEGSDLFTPMNDTDAEGFLDFGMVHFNKVDVYLVMIESSAPSS